MNKPTDVRDAQSPPQLHFDHNSQQVGADRAAAYNAVRNHCPVALSSEYDDFYVFTGWDSVHQVASNGLLFSSADGPQIPTYPSRMGMLDLDPPKSTQVRRAINPLFTRATAEATRPRTRELVDGLIDAFIERGRCDLVRELTGAVPAAITAEGLGMPVDRAAEYAYVFHAIFADAQGDDFPAIVARLDLVLAEIAEVIEQRAATPKDDWISALLAMQVDGAPMARDDVLQNAHLLLSGGLDTTTQLVTWAVWHLHDDRALRERLRFQPELMAPACEEFLRYYTPLVASTRTVTEDTEVCGYRVQGGRRALVSWMGANRDPSIFENPDTFDIDRERHRNLSFGHGGHRCVGQYLARVQFEEIISAVLRRLPDYCVDESAVIPYSAGIINGITELPITFSPGVRTPGSAS